ncbi:MAG: hypothetical protein M9928_16270 [Anaerolineae bacterium]|nr:hypothetical protein [Anaerolineae bacterium]MCO5187757.1 hypothetical protein [Anaerolineae bacterium]MCO5193702.1 hypothetical protein [Anaerolineae bacterium]MCO5206574.1 hypothetical protein [Anaerolineae bacterium]
MKNDIRRLVESIHNANGKLVLVSAGAGAQAIAWLLGVAGASRTLLEALIPYNSAAFDDFLEQTPEQYVSAETGRQLAGRALSRAQWLIQDGTPPIGAACTATIATDRPKRGDHRAHIAVWTPERVVSIYLKLDKGARDRDGEEALVSRVILNAIASVYGLNDQLQLEMYNGDVLETTITDLRKPIEQLLRGERIFVGVHADGRVRVAGVQPQLLLSGSFNPLHAGHLALAQAAMAMTGLPVAMEIPAFNADKPALPIDMILGRLAQFAGRWPVYISSAATFVEKARIFPGATFVVGYDTAVRVLQRRFYGGAELGIQQALAELQTAGCRFLVAGRLQKDGSFGAANELDVPTGFEELFRPIPDFRVDLSSTELRQHGLRGSR